MNIARCKLDKRGRITLPSSFLKANNIYPEDYNVVVQVVVNNTSDDLLFENAIKILFIKKGDKE